METAHALALRQPEPSQSPPLVDPLLTTWLLELEGAEDLGRPCWRTVGEQPGVYVPRKPSELGCPLVSERPPSTFRASLASVRGPLRPTPQRVLVTGSGRDVDLDQVRRFVATQPDGMVLVTGLGRGVEAAAVNEASRRNLPMEVYTPDGYGRAARDAEQLADGVDRAVVFWHGRGQPPLIVERCHRAVVPVEVVVTAGGER